VPPLVFPLSSNTSSGEFEPLTVLSTVGAPGLDMGSGGSYAEQAAISLKVQAGGVARNMGTMSLYLTSPNQATILRHRILSRVLTSGLGLPDTRRCDPPSHMTGKLVTLPSQSDWMRVDRPPRICLGSRSTQSEGFSRRDSVRGIQLLQAIEVTERTALPLLP